MKALADLKERFKRRPKDLVGLDIGASGVKAVRMHKTAEGLALLAADLLPLPADGNGGGADFHLPPRLRARYAALAVSGHEAVVKLLSFPGPFDAKAEAKIVQNMGLQDPDQFRVSYRVTTEGHGRGESRVLAVALAEEEAVATIRLLPVGVPAPFSLEVSGLAALGVFMSGAGVAHADEAVGAIEFGAQTTTFALFNRGNLALVRRFGTGGARLLDHIRQTLGVDADTAAGIVRDGSFDISQSVGETIGPLVKQLVLSRDFVERRENCRVSRVYMAGSMAAARDVIGAVQGSMGVETAPWSFLDVANLSVAKGAIPETVGQEPWRLAAAVGACLGAFEES